MKKRLLNFFVALCFVCSFIPLDSFNAADDIIIGDLSYTILGKSTVSIKRFNPKLASTTEVTIPPTITNSGTTYRVTHIESNAFLERPQLKSVSFEPTSNVTYIGSNAFNGCIALTSITLPDSVTFIGSNAFNGCIALTSMALPNSVAYIKDYAFTNCTALESVQLPANLTDTGDATFSQCSALTSITLPNNLTRIGDRTFNGCSELNSIELPGTLTSIGKYAFDDCKKLTNITIPAGVNSIGFNPFRSSGIPSIAVDPNNPHFKSVDGILFSKDDKTLLAYPSLKVGTEYSIPDGVTSLAGSAFAFCSQLTTVNIPNSVTSIDAAGFLGCSSLKHITIPPSVTSIGNSCFMDCFSLKSITIPASVTSINNFTFARCRSLESITIPASVTSMGGNVFESCSKLAHIFYPSAMKDNIGTDAIPNTTVQFQYSVLGIENGVSQIELDARLGGNAGPELKCSAMGPGYVIRNLKEREIASLKHNFPDDPTTSEPTDEKLGGKAYVCATPTCGESFYHDLSIKKGSNPTLMPDDAPIIDSVPINQANATLIGEEPIFFLYQNPLDSLPAQGNGKYVLDAKYLIPDSDPYTAAFNNLDSKFKEKIKNMQIFDLSLVFRELTRSLPSQSPALAGPALTELEKPIRILYPIPEGWDVANTKVVRVIENGDDMELPSNTETVNNVKYLAFWTNHFSPYAFINSITETPAPEEEVKKEDKSDLISTGDTARYMIFCSVLIMFITGVWIIIDFNKNKKAKNN